MKKIFSLLLALTFCVQLHAWWDAGHLVVAMIAYRQLDDKVKEKVDELVAVLQRDYPHVNHFAAMGPWPDDLKADGVTLYNTMHYTNIPYNSQGVSLPIIFFVNIVCAFGEDFYVLDRL